MAANEPKGGQVVALDERRLLVRHCQGDPAAFSELVRGFRAPVYGYLVRCGMDRASCDDLFQEIFLKVHHAAATYEPEKPLKPWLFTIVVNTVRTHYRRLRVRQLVSGHTSGDSAPPERASDAPRADEELEASETAQAIDRALQALTFAEREVVLLCAVQQLEMKEAASVLALPVNTVKTHLHRARGALARALAMRALRLQREVAR